MTEPATLTHVEVHFKRHTEPLVFTLDSTRDECVTSDADGRMLPGPMEWLLRHEDGSIERIVVTQPTCVIRAPCNVPWSRMKTPRWQSS
jgi:hypothetical protein